MRTSKTQLACRGLAVLLPILAGWNAARADVVGEAEALRIADLWLVLEIGRAADDLSDEQQQAAVAALKRRSVLYIVEGGEMTARQSGAALAYVVVYEAGGFVVVSAEDRLEPVIAFNAAAPFRADEPERNFARHFLGRDLAARFARLRAEVARGQEPEVHQNWQRLRLALATGEPLPTPRAAINVQWATALWNQSPFYNALVMTQNGNNATVPTGCTATAMAIKMRYHRWPPAGAGQHSYTDNQGMLRFAHNVNFANQTYNWGNMPTANLTAANADIAALMYHCGVAVDMDYEPNVSGAWPSAGSMNGFFGYRGTAELTSGHQDAIIRSVRAELPVIISSTAHTVVVSGYRDDPAPFFFFNCGWGGNNNGWYNLDAIPTPADPTIDRSYPYSQPTNWTYADSGWGGAENGLLQQPFNTLPEALNATPNNGRVLLRANAYHATLLNRPMTIASYEGWATITP